MVILAALLIFATIKEPCDAVTSRVQINPFHHKEPIMALYKLSENRAVFRTKKDGSGAYKVCVADYQCSYCGQVIEKSTVKAKRDESCGCKRYDLIQSAKTKHGKSGSTIYNTWMCMVNRCTRPEVECFERYGGRGITVSPEWMSFENFYLDMGDCPVGMTLERIDNNKGYSKENCRWATIYDQCRNRRSNVWLVIDGRKMCIEDWAKESGAVNSKNISKRLKRGWSASDAVFTPLGSIRCGLLKVET